MADIAKYSPINDSTIISDFKSHFSIRKTKKTFSFVYGLIFVFIVFTIFLAVIPSSNLFSITTISTNSPTSSSLFSDRSHFSSIYYYIFPNPSSLNPQNGTVLPQKPIVNQTHSNNAIPPKPSSGSLKGNRNQTQSEKFKDKVGIFKANQTTIEDKSVNSTLKPAPVVQNVTVDGQNEIVKNLTSSPTIGGKFVNTSPKPTPVVKNATLDENKKIVKNLTSSLMKKQNSGEKGIDDLIKNLMNCDMFDGNWVRDESYPLYKPGSCSLIDEQFNCFSNGRPDSSYHKLKWKPKSCNLPRLDGSRMLELLRGKRLVFVGDSLNRNMWESLICILKNSVKDQKKVYEESGRHHFRSEASYSFIFEDYKCTVEFFVSPFLVEEWEAKYKNGTKKETLRLDLIGSYANKYKNADIIVFNTGHWWTHDKTSKGEDYYQEGSHVYRELNVLEAFRKALTTWGRWVDANVNPVKSLVFFRGYSVSHFSGGQWNSGGQCDSETEPIKNDTYLSHYPPKMTVLEKVLKGMKTHVTYLNVTRMTDYRKDGHPSVYRKQHYTDEEKKSPLRFQDCSHWCLPGVPDAWNEILYAELLVKLKSKKN